MKLNKSVSRKNLFLLLLDGCLLAGFWLLNQVRLTGIAIHEWAGVALAFVLLLHVGMLWRWITNMFRKFLRVRNAVQYFKLALDIFGFIAFFAIIISGILMSRSFLPALGLSGVHSRSLKMIHVLATNATIAMLMLHLLVNLKGIIRMMTRSRRIHEREKSASGELSGGVDPAGLG
ncbi:MAG: cytochrome b/b6 domain-containing protein [Anaerolineae bacterium]|nr:cytochrome b/b6 domain-containing protein [Anaerolineae bacterium]